jgi:hypothetical protein
MSAHLAEYDAAFRDVARQYAGMTQVVADALDEEQAAWKKSSESGLARTAAAAVSRARAQAKQARWRGMALNCHVAGDLELAPGRHDDAAAMVLLMVSTQ